MGNCIQSVAAMTEFNALDASSEGMEALGQYVKDYAYLFAIHHGEDDPTPVRSLHGNKYVDLALQDITGSNKSNMWKQVLEMSPENRAFVLKAMDAHAVQIYKSLNNPDKVLEDAIHACRMKSIINRYRAEAKSSTVLQEFSRKIGGLVGLNRPLIQNKINVLQHHNESKRVFSIINQIQNLTESVGKKYLSDIHRSFMEAEQSDILKKYEIDTPRLSGIMKIFDGQENITYEALGKKMLDYLDSRGINVEDDDQRSVYSVISTLVQKFWQINYGNSSGTYKEGDPKYGILRYQEDLKNKYGELYRAYKDLVTSHGDTVHEDIEYIFEPISNAKIRNHYIPMTRESWMLDGIEPNDRLIKFLPDWYKSRDESFETAEEVDFLENISKNVLGTNTTFLKLANATGAKYLQSVLYYDDLNSANTWFSNSARIGIRNTIEDMIHDLDAKVDYRSANQTGMTRAVKLTGNLASIYMASYLMNPGSALTNYVAGFMGLRMRLGEDISRANYNAAIADEGSKYHHIARYIDDYAERWMISSGLAEEFTSYATDNKTKSTFDQASELANKVGDHIGDGMFGKFFETWKEYASMPGSERVLRRSIKAYMFNNMLAEYKLREIDIDPEDKLSAGEKFNVMKDIVEKNVDDSLMEVTNALGLFSGLNKSFYFQGLKDSAEDAPTAMVGTALHVWNTFRSVAVNGFDNILSSAIRSYYDIKMEGMGAINSSAKASAFGCLLITLAATIMAAFKREDQVQISLLNSTTPLEGPVAVARFGYQSIRAMLGGNIDEEQYNNIKADAIQNMVGALGGRATSRVMTQENLAGYQNRMRAFTDPIKTTYDTIVNVGHYNNISEMYEARRNLRESYGSLLSSDPIWGIERIVELLFINNPAPNNDVRFTVDTLKGMVSSFVGLSIYANPDIEPKRWRQYGGEERNRKNIMYARSIGRRSSRKLFSKDVTSRAVYAMEKYGYMPKGRVN